MTLGFRRKCRRDVGERGVDRIGGRVGTRYGSMWFAPGTARALRPQTLTLLKKVNCKSVFLCYQKAGELQWWSSRHPPRPPLLYSSFSFLLTKMTASQQSK